MLSDLGENPKKTKGLFLIKEKATMKILFDETNRRFAQAVLEFDNDEEIDLKARNMKSVDVGVIFSRENQKSLPKRRKN
ncbi:unnamed protein product [Rotaria magnacalcarata]|nr:unnamed protein product [Rotaria magnacalcarata]CAF4247566.1 unnamed protein product [Rotaria magnacalcarata]